jgi:hypothetical protein
LAVLPRAKAVFIAAIWVMRLRVSNDAAESIKLFASWFRGGNAEQRIRCFCICLSPKFRLSVDLVVSFRSASRLKTGNL